MGGALQFQLYQWLVLLENRHRCGITLSKGLLIYNKWLNSCFVIETKVSKKRIPLYLLEIPASTYTIKDLSFKECYTFLSTKNSTRDTLKYVALNLSFSLKDAGLDGDWYDHENVNK